jgi:hypothetical protein
VISEVSEMNVVVTPSAAASISRRIRVMLVDDAVVVRGLFARWVEAEPDLEVVATLRTGRDAVNQLGVSTPMWSCSMSTCRSSMASLRFRCCSRKSAISS